MFQAKKKNNKKQSELLEQVKKMEKIGSGSSAIFEYGKSGYKALDGKEIIDKDAKAIGHERNKAEGLSNYIANNFLACKIGLIDLYYDASRGILNIPSESGSSAKSRLKHRIKLTIESS